MNKVNQKHSGKGNNILVTKTVNNYSFSRSSIFILILLILIFIIFGMCLFKDNNTLTIEPISGPTFQEKSKKLKVLVLPFNNIRDCSQYVSDYELAFSNRLLNLASEYSIPIEAKLFNCQKKIDDSSLIRSLENKYPDIIIPDFLRYYNTAIVNNADVVIYGIYEENCIDSSFVNVDCAIATPSKLASSLVMKNFGETGVAKAKLINEIINLFFPDSELSINKIEDIKEYYLEAPKKYTKFDRMVELEDLDKIFNIDYLILEAFAESAIANDKLNKGLDYYKTIIDNYKSESLIYKMKFSEPIDNLLVNKYNDEKYLETIKLISSFDNSKNDKYIFKLSLIPRFYTTKIMCYIKLGNYRGAYTELKRQRKKSNESIYHFISYINSSIALMNLDKTLQFPRDYIENVTELKKVLRVRDAKFNYLTLKIILNGKDPGYAASRIQNSMSICTQSFNCMLISYFKNENYNFFNLQQYYDYASEVEATILICNQKFKEANSILNKIRYKDVSVYLKMAKCNHYLNKKRLTKENLIKALNATTSTKDYDIRTQLTKMVSQFEFLYSSGNKIDYSNEIDKLVCK